MRGPHMHMLTARMLPLLPLLQSMLTGSAQVYLENVVLVGLCAL